MLQVVSVVGLLAGYPALHAYAGAGTAVSSEAVEAQRAANAVADSAERSHALYGEKAAAISDLAALAGECAAEGWDGNDAAPIDPAAVILARRFVRAMPDVMPLPEFGPEPDGTISLDWIDTRNRMFSLSIGRNNRLAYAWLDGADKGHGVASFDGRNIPPRILEGVSRVLG